MYDAALNEQLLESARKGDAASLELLVENNMGLVRTAALAFRERGVEQDDLIQIGTIGLIKAIRGYDPSFGTVFSTYAVPLIMGEIRKFLRDDGPVKISRRIKQNARTVAAARDSFAAQNDRDPTVFELCTLCSLSDDEVLAALDAGTPLLSFDAEYGDTTLENIVGCDNIEKMLENLSLRQAINALDDTERKIICLRYFRHMTQTTVAQLMGVSQVKISRSEKRALEHLRELLGG